MDDREEWKRDRVRAWLGGGQPIPPSFVTRGRLASLGLTSPQIADALAFAEDPWNHGCLPELTPADRDDYAVRYRAMQSPDWSAFKAAKPTEAEPPRHWSQRAGDDDPRFAELRRAHIAAGVIRA